MEFLQAQQSASTEARAEFCGTCMNLKTLLLTAPAAFLLVSCRTNQESAIGPSTTGCCALCREYHSWPPMLIDAYFNSGSDLLIREGSCGCQDVAVLSLNLEWLKQNPTRQIVITGYCDSVEGADPGLTGLDFRRAQAMKKYLTEHGVAPERIGAVGGGAFTEGVNEFAWAQQRRAEPAEVPVR